jgi:hypothetical protein
MQEAVSARTPAHLWIVGALATLWNAFGSYDYLMTRMRDTEYLAGMMPGTDPNEVLAYIDTFPVWAQAGWALGVWGGLLGGVLLLLRSRWATVAFGVSLLGALLGLGHQIANPGGPAAMHEGVGGIIPYVIIAVCVALFVYARAMQKKRVLR